MSQSSDATTVKAAQQVAKVGSLLVQQGAGHDEARDDKENVDSNELRCSKFARISWMVGEQEACFLIAAFG